MKTHGLGSITSPQTMSQDLYLLYCSFQWCMHLADNTSSAISEMFRIAIATVTWKLLALCVLCVQHAVPLLAGVQVPG